MDYELCIICQKDKNEALKCPALDRNSAAVKKVYDNFLGDWNLFRNSDIYFETALPILDANVNTLCNNKAKWHKNCRRELRKDKLERKLLHQKTNNNNNVSCSVENNRRCDRSHLTNSCLFCKKPGCKRNVLHSFQKIELTEELRKKAIAMNDDNVLTQVSVGDVIANELQYHTYCLVHFNRRFENASTRKSNNTEDQTASVGSRLLEEVLSGIEEELAAGRTYFPLKLVYEEMSARALTYGTAPINRTRLKSAILERFDPLLKEEIGYRNEVILVCSKSMRDMVNSCLVSTNASEDYRNLSKAALICRRDMSKHKSFDFLQEAFRNNCQTDSVCDTLKYLIGLIMYGPSHADNFENEQATLSICQLIYFNSQIRKKYEPPLPIYLGLLVHSKFRSASLVDELHRLGLAVDYNRVKYIERMMGHSVIHQFNLEDTVCPTEMRTGLFTVGAVDNIDHNPSARTSKDSFHGTAISLFQARNRLDEGERRQFSALRNPPKQLKLPYSFTTLPSTAIVSSKKLQILADNTLLTKEDLVEQLKKEEEWAKLVSLQISNDSTKKDFNQKITWSSYHGRQCSEAVPCISGLFPLFTESSTDPRMILHAMHIVKQSVSYLNPNQVPVITGDQPVYAIMKKLQRAHESVKGMIVMLGGFHTEKHCAKAIGDLLQGSGWSRALVEAGIANSGTADGILSAVHVTKARYSHQVTYVALQMLLHEAYQETSKTDFDTWLKERYKYPTFAFWNLVMKYQAIMLAFVRAHREGNFNLYVESLEHIGQLFFALDHYHYARWVPIHVEDMKRLPQSIINEFLDGKFAVNRTNKRFSSIAIDQSHEQLNKQLKGSGGVIGLTQNTKSLINWSVYSPEVSKQIEAFKVASNVEMNEECDFFHHDEGRKRQDDFISDVKCMSDAIKSNGNPFHEPGQDLISLEGQISEDNQSVYLIEKSGRQQYQRYVKEVLVDKTKPFDDPLKKNNFLLFKAPKKKREKQRKIEVVKANLSVFGKMFVSIQSRKGNIDQFFEHEVQGFPPSIADNTEKMYHSKKSDIIDCLRKEVELVDSTDVPDIMENFDAVVLDGGALIHSIIPRSGLSTFEEYVDFCLLKYIYGEFQKTCQLHLVWDSYWEVSIKDGTRENRGTGVRLKVGPTVRLPKNWAQFLCKSENKVELFRYLNEAVMRKLEPEKNCDFYVTNGESIQHVGSGPDILAKCDHEEADTKIVQHVLYALQEGAKTVLVKTVDSDVVIILIHHYILFQSISEGCTISIRFGTGKNIRRIDVKQVCDALGPDRSRGLCLWMALTGCDSTSSLRGRSKRTAFNAWKKSPETLTTTFCQLTDQPFTNLTLESTHFKELEKFFIKVYGDGADTINGLRKEIFYHRNQNPDMMPPTQNALLQHCKRAIYQMSIWVSSHLAKMNVPDPCDFGWKKQERKLLPVWITIPEVSAACQELIKCACKRNCANACSCKKNNLHCTALCKCPCEV